MPAFLVPFVFVLDPQGLGLLLTIPKGGSWVDVVLITLKTAAGLMALAAAAQGWALRRTTMAERVLLVLAGLFLVFPSLLEALIENNWPESATPRHWRRGVGIVMLKHPSAGPANARPKEVMRIVGNLFPVGHLCGHDV